MRQPSSRALGRIDLDERPAKDTEVTIAVTKGTSTSDPLVTYRQQFACGRVQYLGNDTPASPEL